MLVASLRGPWHIEGSITDKIAPIHITIFPDKAEEYDSVEREIVSRINDKTSDEIIEELMKSKIFKQGYELDELADYEFSLFYPVKATLNQFSDNYDELTEYISK